MRAVGFSMSSDAVKYTWKKKHVEYTCVRWPRALTRPFCEEAVLAQVLKIVAVSIVRNEWRLT